MTEQHKILVIGPDKSENELTVFYLTQALFETKTTENAEKASQECAIFGPDLILLDADFSGPEPDALCLNLRAQSGAPILFLSERSDPGVRIRALEAGADVCMTKPFDVRELLAQIRALLRRSCAQGSGSAVQEVSESLKTGKFVEYPDLLINLTSYTVLYMGKSIETPPKELELFYFLAASPNQVFSREQLLDRLWGFDYMGDNRTVDVHIKRLREKFPATKDWAIRTVWGVGYKFEVKNYRKQI